MSVDTAPTDADPATEPGVDHGLISRVRSFVTVLVAIGVALVLGGFILWAAGGNPFEAYWDIITGTFGSSSTIGLMLTDVVPLLIIGLGLAIAFRSKVWNIGAEGQYVVGAAAGGAVGILVPIDVGIVLIPIALVAGAAAGGIWGWVVGKLKALWAVNEVISSLLMNYVAIFAMAYLVRQPLRDPDGFLPQSDAVNPVSRLPDLSFLKVHSGLLIALALVPLVAYLVRRTPFGFRSQMLGFNPDATSAAGVDTGRLIIRIMVLSGGLAGLAGVVQILGVEGRLTNNIATGFGFTAIIVALLGRMRPVGVMFATFFIAILTVGGDIVQRSQQVPRATVFVLQALFVIVLVVADRLVRK